MPSYPEEVALIRAIVAHPDEDTPRLVYADWLDEHGRGDRARLIRVQCAVVGLQAEEQALIEKHGREWGKALFAAGGNDWKFHRGFPEEVTMRFKDYFSEHAQLNDLTPLSRLHLTGGTDEDLRQLADLPAAHQIRSLEVDRRSSHPTVHDFGIEGIRSLAASPHLGGLRGLRLHSHRVGVAGAEVIAGAPTFANLTHLVLTDPALQLADPDTVRRIITAPHLSRLIEFQFGDATCGSHLLQVMRSGGPSQTDDRGPP